MLHGIACFVLIIAGIFASSRTLLFVFLRLQNNSHNNRGNFCFLDHWVRGLFKDKKNLNV